MVYPTTHLRLVASGRLYDADMWSFGLAIVRPGGVDAPETIPNVIVSAVTGLFSGGSGVISNAASLDLIKLNRVGPNGRYTEDVTVQHAVTPPAASQGTTLHAPQVSLAVSLLTTHRRGLAAKGRIYLPVPNAEPTSRTNPLIAENIAGLIQADVVTMIEGINSAGLGYVGVVSDVGAGAQRYVTQVRVGRVLDTIRSRRSAFPEAYITPTDLDDVPEFGSGGVGGGF